MNTQRLYLIAAIVCGGISSLLQSSQSTQQKPGTTPLINIIKLSESGATPYEVLGIAQDADKKAIEDAYRKLSLRLHPDKWNQFGKEEFELAQQVFKIISNARDQMIEELGKSTCNPSPSGRTQEAQATHKPCQQDQPAMNILSEARIGTLTNEKLKEYLGRGDNINAQDKDGHTALMLASLYDHDSDASLLIYRGADVNVKSKNGESALKFANVKVTRLLLEKRVCVDVQDDRGATPLMIAAITGNVDKIVLLLNAGAHPYLRTCDKEAMEKLGMGEELAAAYSNKSFLDFIKPELFQSPAIQKAFMNNWHVIQAGKKINSRSY